LLASEVRLVIHSIFDAESFLLLAIDDGIEELLESITSSVDPPLYDESGSVPRVHRSSTMGVAPPLIGYIIVE